MQLIAGIINESQYNDSNVLNENIITDTLQKLKLKVIEKLVNTELLKIPKTELLTLKDSVQDLISQAGLSNPDTINLADAKRFVNFFVQKVKTNTISEDVDDNYKRQKYEDAHFVLGAHRISRAIKLIGLYHFFSPFSFSNLYRRVVEMAADLVGSTFSTGTGDIFETVLIGVGYGIYVLIIKALLTPIEKVDPDLARIRKVRDKVGAELGLSDDKIMYDDLTFFKFKNPLKRNQVPTYYDDED